MTAAISEGFEDLASQFAMELEQTHVAIVVTLDFGYFPTLWVIRGGEAVKAANLTEPIDATLRANLADISTFVYCLGELLQIEPLARAHDSTLAAFKYRQSEKMDRYMAAAIYKSERPVACVCGKRFKTRAALYSHCRSTQTSGPHERTADG